MVTLSIQFQSCLMSLGPSVVTFVIVVGLLDVVIMGSRATGGMEIHFTTIYAEI
jgi:hypothetical protein